MSRLILLTVLVVPLATPALAAISAAASVRVARHRYSWARWLPLAVSILALLLSLTVDLGLLAASSQVDPARPAVVH